MREAAHLAAGVAAAQEGAVVGRARRVEWAGCVE